MVIIMLSILACDYNDEHFNGLDDITAVTDVKSLTYTLESADYASIASNSTNIALAAAAGVSEELANLKTTLKFSATLPATDYIPAFLASKWYTADNGSAVKLSYNSSYGLPEYLSLLSSAETYSVTSDDYAAIWGDVDAKYFSPSEPLNDHINKILTKAFPTAVSNDLKVVSYNYSESDPEGYVPYVTSIDESFDGVTSGSAININKWISLAQTGTVDWVGKLSGDNYYTQCSAYNASSEVVSWLISPTLSVADLESPVLTFDVCMKYYNADCLQVLLSEDYDGSDPASATWIDVTHFFGYYGNSTDYSTLKVAGLCDLSNYTKKPINIAFKYSGDGTANKTTTYQIDNVQVNSLASVRVTKESVFTENFSSGIDTWGNILVQGTKKWSVSSYNGIYRANFTANGTTEEQECWLVSPKITVPSAGVPQLLLDVISGYYNATCLSVFISIDYTGDVSTATWDNITDEFDLPETTSYGAISTAPIGAASLIKYAGKDIYVALRYVGNGSDSRTTTYQVYGVDVVNLMAFSSTSFSVKSSSSQKLNSIYTFDGSSWSEYEDATVLNPSDYISMGVDNFSSSVSADDYLPKYLEMKYPYAKEKETVAVVYNYYSNNALTLASDEYIYTSGAWVKTVVTNQFVRNDGKWFWDPSVVINLLPIKYNATSVLYFQAATDWVWENIDQAQLGITTKGQGYVTSYGNNEYYTGCSAYNNNVDLRPSSAVKQYAAGYTGLSDAEISSLMTEHLIVVMGKVLSKLHPDAAVIDGVDVTYTINLGLYTGTSISQCTHSLVYKVVGTGEFEYVSGPTEIK